MDKKIGNLDDYLDKMEVKFQNFKIFNEKITQFFNSKKDGLI